MSRAWLGNTHLSHSLTWQLESTDSDHFQPLHNLHFFWAPDSPFAELFELNGSSRNTVMLAENKSLKQGDFQSSFRA